MPTKILVAAVLLALAAYPRQAPAAGTIHHFSYFSRALHERVEYDTYLPPDYAREAAQGRRFPVLYLLHTPAGVRDGFYTAGLMPQAAQRLKPMIMVDPMANTRAYGNDTEWANTAAGPYESFVVELVHQVDRTLATIPDRRHRALAGVSMGGYGAINLALRHLDLFSIAESWSGYYHQTATGPYAGASPATLAATSPADELPRYRGQIRRLGLRAWLYQGTDDDVPAADMGAFARALHAAGAEVRYGVFPGKHNWALWRPQVPRMLAAVSDWFAQAPRHGERATLERCSATACG